MDLVIIDLNMPVMGGIEATQKIKDFFKSDLIEISRNDCEEEKLRVNSKEVAKYEPYIVALTASEINEQLENEFRNG